MNEFLKDQTFLDQLDSLKVKDQYIRMTILSWNEEPISEIQGRTIGGSLNLNGSSSMRRTANLTLFAEEKDNDLTQIDQDLSINKKVKLELGFLNTVPKYKYFLTNTNGVMEPKEIDYVEKYGKIIWFPLGIFVIFDPNISHGTNGVTISVSLKDKMCLLNGDAGGIIPASTEFHVREYEDETGAVTIEPVLIRQIIQECVQHWGIEDPARIIISDVDNRIRQVVRWNGAENLYYATTIAQQQGLSSVAYFLNLDEAISFVLNKAISSITNEDRASAMSNIVTLQQGDEVGFILTDFIYPGELIGDAGSSVTDILDKIISVLGNYEYFYDAEGNFHFQEIKNYLNITYTTQALKDNTVGNIDYDADFVGGKSVYNFTGSKLISSFANSPKYSNIKNDFVVWGVKTNLDGSQVPIRYHLAIDNVPIPTKVDSNKKAFYDTHNLIWYTDEYNIYGAKPYINLTPPEGTSISMNSYDYREELYMQGIESSKTGSDYSYYFTELLWEWPKIWDFQNHTYKTKYAKDPSKLDFFLDILSAQSSVGKYSVSNIGRRSVVVSDDKINCIFEQTVPDVIIINNHDTSEVQNALAQECDALGQYYTKVNDSIYALLSIGGAQNSCYQRVCELLYQYTNMNETVTIQAIPLYYLEPNTRITVHDPASGIFGDFMIQTISLPLTINGTMSITASRAQQKI